MQGGELALVVHLGGALARALGAKVINGSVCLDIPVSEVFGRAYNTDSRPMHELQSETAQVPH